MGIGHHIGGNDAFTNGIGDMRADKGGTHDIQDAGYKNSPLSIPLMYYGRAV